MICVPLILGLIGKGRIAGVCIGVAVAGFLARGILQWVYGTRLLRVSLGAYIRQVFLPVTLAAVPSVAALYAAVAVLQPQSLGWVLALGAAYSILFAATLAWALLGYARVKTMITTAAPYAGAAKLTHEPIRYAIRVHLSSISSPTDTLHSAAPQLVPTQSVPKTKQARLFVSTVTVCFLFRHPPGRDQQ